VRYAVVDQVVQLVAAPEHQHLEQEQPGEWDPHHSGTAEQAVEAALHGLGPGQDQQQPLSPQSEGRDPRGANGGQEPPDDDGTGTHKTPKPGDEVAVGPIIGVRSRSEKASFLVFNGRQRYDEWRFTVDLIMGAAPPRGTQGGAAFVPNPAANAQGTVTPGSIPQMNSRWIGRPWDQSLVPPGMGMPGQNPPNTGLQPAAPNTLGGRPRPRPTNPVN